MDEIEARITHLTTAPDHVALHPQELIAADVTAICKAKAPIGAEDLNHLLD